MSSSGGGGKATVHLPPGPWTTVLDFLCDRFARIDREAWADRMARGRVIDDDGRAILPSRPYLAGLRVTYHREVLAEARVAGAEAILHADAHLIVADKPHFLPVMPAGDHVDETLVGRLVRRLGNPALVALHRLDRHTAGLVLLSPEPASRARYHALFTTRAIVKRYECIAPALPELRFPLVRSSRLAAGDPFFRVREVDGPPNAETRVDVLERGDRLWRYVLQPITGRKHQLRVHMAALGAPIVGDPFYPTLAPRAPDDPARPLKLLAKVLELIDPVTGERRRFESPRSLGPRG